MGGPAGVGGGAIALRDDRAFGKRGTRARGRVLSIFSYDLKRSILGGPIPGARGMGGCRAPAKPDSCVARQLSAKRCFQTNIIQRGVLASSKRLLLPATIDFWTAFE